MIILPSLEIVPAKYNGSTLLSQIPIDGTGDFTVTRATSPTTGQSTRVNALGLIETVLDNVPRLDYPLGGAVNGCPALLVEPSAQNICLQSADFGTTWSRTRINAFGSGSVLNTTATLDPFGTNLADYIQEDTSASDTHRISQDIAITSGTTYTYTCFIKSAERFQAALYLFIGGVERYGVFNTNAGTATANNATVGIDNFGNGWYRCRVTFTATASVTQNFRILICDDSGNLSYTGTGTKGIYVFGAQLETGSVATSYIPTVASGITRAADVIKDTTASGVIGQVEGTVYWEGAINRLDRIFFTLASGSSTTDLVRLQTTGAGLFQGVVVLTGTLQCAVSSLGAITLGQFNKVAFAYKQDDFVLYLNGVRQNADVSGSLPTNLNTVYFLSSNGTEITDQQCRAAALYPTRLTDTQLALLTSPYTSYSSMASALSYTLG